MRLAKIRVRNIRSYAEATLDLDEGTTLLVGDVGAGKTSLLYAVEMALFGTAEVDAAYLVRHGAAEAEVAVTLAEDDHMYEFLRTFRRVHRKGKETFEPGKIAYRQDGATTSYSATEVRQRVIDLLGFRDNPNPRAHSDLWRWAVYVPQERMREILAAPPKERLETVRRALGVERYRIAAENAKEAARDLRQTASALRSSAELLRRFDDEYVTVAAELRRLDEERAAAAVRRASLESERAEATRAASQTQEALLRLEADARLRGSLRSEEATDQRTLAGQQATQGERRQEAEQVEREIAERVRIAADAPMLRTATIAAAEDVGRYRKEVEQRASAAGLLGVARARIAELERRLKTLTAEEERTRTQVDSAHRRLTENAALGPDSEPRPPFSETLEAIDRRLGEFRAEETRRRESAAVARRALAEVEDLVAEGVCPRCGQTVRSTEFAVHRDEARSASAEAEAAVQAAESQRRHEELRRVERERYDREWERWGEARRRRTDLEHAVSTAEDAARRTETSLVECRVSLEAARREADDLVPAESDLVRVRARLAAADQALTEARGRLDAAERAGDRAQALRERLASLRSEAERSALETDALRERMRVRAVKLAELDEGLGREGEARQLADGARRRREQADALWQRAGEELTRWATQQESLSERLARAESGRREREQLELDATLTEAKASWLSGPFYESVLTMETRVLERAQAEFQHEFRRFFGALVDDPDLRAVSDSSFSPEAEIRGVRTPAEALSGGERTSLALAYRLALAQVVRSTGHLRLTTLLLDEPTDGFSPEQVQSMGQLLETLHLPQVVLVSHERELESVAQRVVWVEKEEGESRLRGAGAPRGAPDELT